MLGELHGEEGLRVVPQRSRRLVVGTTLVHQGVGELGERLVLDGGVALADHTDGRDLLGDRVVEHRGVLAGDDQTADGLVIFADVHPQGALADVPVGQVSGLQGFLGGHGVTDRNAELVPGVDPARAVELGVREAGDSVGGADFVSHDGSFPGWVAG